MLQLLIMLYHFFTLHSPSDWSPKPTKPLSKHYFLNMPDIAFNGFTAVGLFFALSGFMAGYTSFKRFETLNTKNYFTYVIKRFSRLAFLYYASLVIGIVCIYDVIWNNLSFLQLTIVAPGLYFWNADLQHWNTPLWFVSQLFLFYLLVPMLIRVLRNQKRKVLIALLGFCYIVTLGGFVALWCIEPPTNDAKKTKHVLGPMFGVGSTTTSKGPMKIGSALFYETFVNQGPYFNFFQFLMGLILGIYLQNYPFQPVKFATDTLSAIFLGSVIMCSVWAKGDNYRFLNFMYWDRFLMFPLYAAWFVLMTLDGGIVTRFVFDNPIMLKFGKASYAIYVLHNVVWRWLRVTINPNKPKLHPEYNYQVFDRKRLDYVQAPFAFFVALCVAWVMYEMDAWVSPKLNQVLMSVLDWSQTKKKENIPTEEKNEEKAIEVV